MTSRLLAKPRRGWLIPAIIAAVSFLGGAATEILGDHLREILSPYRKWVWIVFALAFITAIVVAIKESRKDKDAPPSNQDSSTIERNVSAGQDIKNSRVITGDQNPTDTHGDVVYGTKIEQHVHQSETFVVSSVRQVPAPPQDFTGRKEELSDLIANIGKGATISGLRGLGGVGKTTLALKVCEAIKPRYPDGQIYLDLKGVTDHQTPVTSNEAMLHVIRAYEPLYRQPDSDNELRGKYRSVLDGRRVLLLMDNAEGRDQVEPLLPPESCAMIVTSRQHFTLPGMKTTDLDAMTPADARELLLKIALEIDERAADLAEMCGRLPLALRLAASAIAESGMKVEDYVRRLKDARKLMDLIDASISLSCDLLTEGQQKLWSALAVFPGSFDVAAAASVWEMEYDAALDALSELKKRSMIELKESRYWLHDLARLCADARLSDEERDAAKQRHARHYGQTLEQVDALYRQGGEAVKRAVNLFDLERENIEAGWAWAESLVESDDEAAQLCIEYPDAGRYALNLRQHSREWIRWSESQLVAARRLNKRDYEGYALGNLGVAYKDLGEMRKAIEFFDQVLVIAREIDDRQAEGTVLNNLGLAYFVLGETRKAIEFYEQSLVIGDRREEGYALNNLGLAYAALGETRKATEFYEQALVIDREIGDRRGEGYALGNLGLAYRDLGEMRKAIEFFAQQIEIAREIGDRRSEGTAVGNLGGSYILLGETRKAIEFCEQALAILRELGDRMREGTVLGTLGVAYADLGETRKAIEYHEKYLAIAREIGDRRGEGNATGNLGVAYKNLGETRKAIEFYEQRLIIAREIGDRRGEGNALWNMSLSLDKLGERARAIECAKAALKIREEIESPYAEKVREQLEEWRGEAEE